MKAKSGQFPGQIGESEGIRGIDGKLAGERTFEEYWIESGAAKELAKLYMSVSWKRALILPKL